MAVTLHHGQRATAKQTRHLADAAENSKPRIERVLYEHPLGSTELPFSRRLEDVCQRQAEHDRGAGEAYEAQRLEHLNRCVHRSYRTVLVPGSPELMIEIRDTVIALSGPPERLTMARFAEEAFRRELERLQTAYNSGKPFDPTDGVVRVGRPVGT